ncbi:hypothetical protein [Legionella spiritensis]|uniref:Uncharacterized protein n=1 Tax=Legionella spiritensis TaxID=452 RepID=A0A0W0YW65_LEGSP|nr:hypothetical protein [Legionella spiritensis]KTD61090.1 hypothetical protein Lspi_2710 [Legionella spiritensis]SNV44824.1 Uncharacterised protein [Legionella spiritensis]VEG90866.1 Uncharacterised protein [Legionella spiritensis]
MKTKLAAYVLFGLFSSDILAGNLILTSMPDGLRHGTFSVQASYAIDMFPGSHSTYSHEGPVENAPGYDLQGSLASINQFINDDINSLSLTIRLNCANNASVTYRFGDEIVNAEHDIALNPPEHCG